MPRNVYGIVCACLMFRFLGKIHSGAGEREKISALITTSCNKSTVLICRRCAFPGE